MMRNARFFDYGGHMGTGFWLSGWNWIIILGVILAAAAAIYLIVKGVKKNRLQSGAAQEELSLKFAEGEITEEEYLKRKKFLEDK